ncbi:SDR family NAD(P)-dependent oxidoreductase [Citrobacter koseri]|uniref:SDR family NAD(P)-dependent oxidoreductase n=1 Tax=Citrobacter koseri TaxID=545 RepID=UPI001F409997|nr:SDR family oxidoreductase [Citrobacter koseri]
MKKILITGSASGIGNFITRELFHKEHSIIAVDLKKDHTLPESITQIVCDLSSWENCLSCFSDINHINYAVNCAGISGIRKPLHDLTEQELHETWQKVFISCFNSLKYETILIKRNPSEKGKIINIGSFTAAVGRKEGLAYSAAKAAVVNLTKVAAAELSPTILVNSISPATIDTPMIRSKYDNNLPDYSNTYPSGSCGTPQDVYSAVEMFLNNNFLTGYDLVMDGGYSEIFSLR